MTKGSISWSQKNKTLILKAIDRSNRGIMAWVIDGGDAQTFARRYEKVNHLTDRIFDTDDWEALTGGNRHPRRHCSI